MNRLSGSIVLIAAAVIVAVLIIIYALGSYTGLSGGGSVGGEKVSSTSIATTTQTTFYVSPRNVLPSARPSAVSGQAGEGADTTPPAPAPSRGGFLSGIFGGITGRKTLPAGFTQADLSPSYGLVTITSVRTNKSTAPGGTPDVVSIRANGGAAVITGWQLRANRDGATIPQGVRVYHTTPVPLERIELRRGEVANIYAAASPLGANFAINKCSGYLATSYRFVPNISLSCPRPAKSQIDTFTGICQDYILRLRTCEEGNPGAPQTAGDPSCRSFIAANLTYEGCVKQRQADADFFRNEWRVWVGRRFLDPLHDRVLLLDANGKLVDWYSY